MRWKADRISTREEMSGCDGTKEAKSRRMLSTHQRFARIHSQFKIQHGWNVFRWEFADFKLKFISHLRSICFELISMAFQLDIFNLFFPSTDNQTTDSASFSQWLLVVSQVEARFEIDTHGSSIRVGWRQREMCSEWQRKKCMAPHNWLYAQREHRSHLFALSVSPCVWMVPPPSLLFLL